MLEISTEDARRARWSAQLLGGSALTPTQVVDRAVAFQGQDLPAVLRAIALRSAPGTTVSDVKAAFDRGELVRSWPVRGTLFATTPAHLRDLLALTSERIHRSTVTRRAQLGLDDDTVQRARDIALPELPLTRSELLALWENAGISATSGRGYHLIFHHAVAGVWHWGAFRGKEQLLAATPRNAPDTTALPRLVRALVTARGPVSTADLAWWTKLPKTQIHKAAGQLTAVSIEGSAAWTAEDPHNPGDTGVTLIPAFDEWVLGYGDRSLIASPEMQKALVPGNNGVFRPAVLVDGRVVGTWRGSSSAKKTPSFDLCEKVPAAVRRRIAADLAAWPHHEV